MKNSILLLLLMFTATALSNNIAIIELSFDGNAYHMTQFRQDSGFTPTAPQSTRGIPLTVTTNQGITQIIYLPLERLAEGSSQNSTVMTGGYLPLQPYKTIRVLQIPSNTKTLTASLDNQVMELKLNQDRSFVWVYIVGSICLLITLIVLYWSRKTR